MLNANASRSVCYFSVDFAPRVDFVRRLVDFVSSVERTWEKPPWGATAEKYVFQILDKQYVYVFENKKIFCQSLGLAGWSEHLDEHVAVLQAGMKSMGVDQVLRIGLLVQSWFDLGMAHAELCDLMYGSFLSSDSELSTVFGPIDDVLVQFHGSHENLKTRTQMSPQSTEQSMEVFLRTNNLDSFLSNRFLDTRIKDFHDRIATENFFMEIEVYREGASANELRPFIRDSLTEANRLSDASISRLKNLHAKDEVRRGSPKL